MNTRYHDESESIEMEVLVTRTGAVCADAFVAFLSDPSKRGALVRTCSTFVVNDPELAKVHRDQTIETLVASDQDLKSPDVCVVYLDATVTTNVETWENGHTVNNGDEVEFAPMDPEVRAELPDWLTDDMLDTILDEFAALAVERL